METKEMKRMPYVSPQIEVIPVETEGVIAGSVGSAGSGLPGVGDGGSAFSRTRPYGGYNSAGSSEIEDLINDILTIEQ